MVGKVEHSSDTFNLQVKSERDELTMKLKRKEEALEKIKQDTSLLSEQVEVSRQEHSDSISEQDYALRSESEKNLSVRKLSAELTKSQQKKH